MDLYEGTAERKKKYDEIYDIEFKKFLANDGTPVL